MDQVLVDPDLKGKFMMDKIQESQIGTPGMGVLHYEA